MWHWQQYFTFWIAIIACFCFVCGAFLTDQSRGKINALIQLGLVAFGQYVLYSGGWYVGH